MKNAQELNDDIIEITLLIKSKYPELVEYISEMPDGIPVEDGEEPLEDRLKLYYDSLVALLSNYTANHNAEPKLPE